MLRLLLVTLGGDIGVTPKPIPLPPILNILLPSCLSACFLGVLFNTSFKAYVLFFRNT